MKVIQLQYPDEASLSKILDDLTVLSRNTGQRGHRASAAFNDAGLEGLRAQLAQRSVPVGTPVAGPLPGNQAVVTSGASIAITGGSVALTVAGSVVTGGAFTPI